MKQRKNISVNGTVSAKLTNGKVCQRKTPPECVGQGIVGDEAVELPKKLQNFIQVAGVGKEAGGRQSLKMKKLVGITDASLKEIG